MDVYQVLGLEGGGPHVLQAWRRVQAGGPRGGGRGMGH